jgi:CHAT domain-containing protein
MEIGDANLRGRATTVMGSSLRDQGKLEEALGYYDRALNIFRTAADLRGQARVMRMMGLIYRLTGDLDRAMSFAQDSLRIAREARDAASEQGALYNLGVLETERGHPGPALQYVTQALAIPTQDTLMRSQILSVLSEIHCDQHQYELCMDFARQQLAIAEQSGNVNQMAMSYQQISVAQKAAGDNAAAYDSAVKSLLYLRATDGNPNTEWRLLADIGQLAVALGRDQEAADWYRQAIAIVERLRQTVVPTEQARALNTAATRPLFDGVVDVLYRLNQSEALRTVELSRARAFLSILAESQVDLRDGLSQEDRDTETELIARVASVQRDLVRTNLSEADRKQRTADLASVEAGLEAHRLAIRRSNPRLSAVQYPQPLGLEQIQQSLQPGTTLLEYYLAEKRSFVWAISKDRSSSVMLSPEKEIATAVAAYRKILTPTVSALTIRRADTDTSRLSTRLYELLIQPVESSLSGTTNLIVIPDRELYYLPFEALAARADHSSLLRRFAISYAASGTSLSALPRSAEPVSRMLLAFGDPAYSKTGGADLETLPFSAQEVNGIASLFPKDKRSIYLGDRAREDAVKGEALEDYRYIHFATHGILDEAHPSRSGLALSTSAASQDDGILQVAEITGLRLRADLVTLSACSTGLGELVSGEGMLGLVRAFLYAGASNVAVSLWNVNDAATSTLMKEFYRNLSLSVSPPEALRRAQLSMLRQSNPLWHHPRYWAPFVLWSR